MQPPIAEAFMETTWDDAEAARAARDQRAAELQAAGYECSCTNLWNVAGYRVFVLTAEQAVPERISSRDKPKDKRSSPSPSKRPTRRQVVL